MIIDHTHPDYIRRRGASKTNRWNGAYYYSREIVQNIIPWIETDRNWITINVPEAGAADHSIVFIHNNLHSEYYDWLREYRDLVLVCGIPETCAKVCHLGTAVYLPLSVDVEEVEKYRCDKKKDVAYVGRRSKRRGIMFPENTEYLEALPRELLLARLAEYRHVFAIGRTAIEAKILGCNILAYDPRFPDPGRWKILDNKDAAVILQRLLMEVDGHVQ